MPNPDTPASPPPALLPSATRRRRRRHRHLLLSPFSAAARTSPSAASSSAASSPASSAGGLSLFSFSRSPSPFHHRFFLSPLHGSASAVPFAWEHRPGVPKTPARQSRVSSKSAPAKAPAPPLPLPPSRLLLSAGGKVGNAGDDCFVVSDEGAKEKLLGTRVRRRQPALASATLTDCFRVLSFCRSCTMSRDCVAGTPPKRPSAVEGKAVPGWWSDC